MDKVAGFLEVGSTEDTHEVVISVPNLKLDANGTARIAFSPRHARYLANLLTEHATYLEAEAVRMLPEPMSCRPRKPDKRTSRPK